MIYISIDYGRVHLDRLRFKMMGKQMIEIKSFELDQKIYLQLIN